MYKLKIIDNNIIVFIWWYWLG